MSRPQQYRDVDLPENFKEWDINARVNYLQNAMDREKLARLVRALMDLPDERGSPYLLKDELAEIAIRLQDIDV